MTLADELIELSGHEAAALVHAGDVASEELVSAHLSRIEAVEGAVKAFITVASEAAVAEARGRDRVRRVGGELGPLHGVPIAIKDNVDATGMPSTAGSAILRSNVPHSDATAVARLRKAGAVVLGKTNLHEFAFGGTTENPFFGSTRNPWNLSRSAAGSSGGSGAALAAREAPLTIGTDTGGSIRLPASVCGVVGLRPTIGRVSNHGSVPCAWTMDTVGPMARTVLDCAQMLQVMAGPDVLDPRCATHPVADYPAELEAGLRGLTFGVPFDFAFENIQPDVAQALEAALDVLRCEGAKVVEKPVAELDNMHSAFVAVHLCEPSAYHAEWLRTRPDEYGDDVRRNLEVGGRIRATDYIQAQRFRELFRCGLLELMQEVDVIVTPTLPFTGADLGGETVELCTPGALEDPMAHLSRFTAIASAAGLPALSLPCGFDRSGLPVGMMFMGRPFDEARLLRAARGYERSVAWHEKKPILG